MKNIIITLLLTLVGIGVQAQKIKIKKGAILVDKVKIGQIEKIKIKNDSVKETYHQVSDNEGNPIFNFRQEYIPSLLFLEDKKYRFQTIESIMDQKRAAIQNPKYYPSEKQMAKYLVNYNLLNEKGVNKDAITELILNKDRLPDAIQKVIEEEKEIRSYANYKVDRELSDPVFIFFDTTKTGSSDLKYLGIALKSRYNIYQGIKDPKTNEFVSKTFIGYAMAEWKSDGQVNNKSRPNPKRRYSLVVYNVKHVPLASYLFISYKTYFPYEEFGPTKNKLGRIESVVGRIEYIVFDLLAKNML